MGIDETEMKQQLSFSIYKTHTSYCLAIMMYKEKKKDVSNWSKVLLIPFTLRGIGISLFLLADWLPAWLTI